MTSSPVDVNAVICSFVDYPRREEARHIEIAAALIHRLLAVRADAFAITRRAHPVILHLVARDAAPAGLAARRTTIVTNVGADVA